MAYLHNRNVQLTLIVIAAIVIRLVTMVALESYRFSKDQRFGYGYGSTARHLVLGEGFSAGYYPSGAPRESAISPPGYVYFLALVFSIFGIYSVQSAIVVEIFQTLTAAFTCLAFYHLGKKLDEKIGLLAALMMAIYPPSIFFSVMRIGTYPDHCITLSHHYAISA